MKRQLFYLSTLTAISLFLAAGPATAQTADAPPEGGDGTGTIEAGAPADLDAGTNEGAFEALSPGGQKIARALVDAQKQSSSDGNGNGDTDGTGATDGTDGTGGTTMNGGDGTGTNEAATSLSLDDIAAAKSAGTGWGRVFKEMKAEGLIAERNLGQVVSGVNHRNRLGAGDDSNDTGDGTDAGADSGGTTAVTTAATAVRAVPSSGHRGKPVTVTLGNGATVVVGGHGRGHALRGDVATDTSGTKSGPNRGHGVGRGAADRDVGVLLGNHAPAGNSSRGSINSGHGSINSGPGSISSGHGSINSGPDSINSGHGGGHGSGKTRGR